MAIQKEYWTVEELSAFSGFAVTTIYGWTSAGTIPYHKINGNVRFHIEQTKRFFESKKREPRKVLQQT